MHGQAVAFRVPRLRASGDVRTGRGDFRDGGRRMAARFFRLLAQAMVSARDRDHGRDEAAHTASSDRPPESVCVLLLRPVFRCIVDNICMPRFEEETTRFLDAWMQVRQIVQASNFNRFQRAGLSATQFMTLNVVPKDGMTLSDLARKLNLSAATLNETVNSLEERGLVVRTPDRADARKVIIRATRQGETMQNSASQEFHAFMSSLFARMSKTRREGLLAGLEQMVKLSQPGPENPTRRVGAAPRGRRNSPQSPQR